MNANLNPIDYVNRCIAGISSDGVEKWTSVAALAVLGLFALILVCKMIGGFSNGSRRKLHSTSSLLLSLIISLVLTRITSRFLLNLATAENIEKALAAFLDKGDTTTAYANAISNLPLETLRYVLSVPISILLSPILFLAIYIAVRVIFMVLKKIFSSADKIDKPENILERIAGLCLGAVEAVIVFSVIILPITNLASFADELVTVAEEAGNAGASEIESDFEKIEAAYTKYVEPVVANNPAFIISTKAVNTTVTNVITETPTYRGEDLREEFFEALDIILIDVPEIKQINFKQPSAEEKTQISSIIDKFAENAILSEILSGTVSTAATVVTTDALGIKIDPPYSVIVDDVLEILKGCTDETLKEDLHLFKNVYFLLADEQIIENITDTDALLKTLTTKREGEEKTVVQKVLALINENERTKNLVTTLTKLSITMLAEELNNTEFTVDETYEELKGAMNEVLDVKNQEFDTEEEYIEALTDTLDTNLKEHNINIDKEIVENIATYIDKTYPSATEFSDEEFNDVLLSYFDAYIEYQNTGKIPEDMIPPDFNVDDIPDDIIPPDVSLDDLINGGYISGSDHSFQN